LNADRADEADENRIRMFSDAPSFRVFFVWLVWFVVRFLESRNHEAHEPREEDTKQENPCFFRSASIRLIRPIRVQKNV